MSDKQDQKEQAAVDEGEAPAATGNGNMATGANVATEGAIATEGQAAALEMNDAAAAATAGSPAPAPRQGSSAIAWLALLLVLGLAGAAGWSLLEAERREAALLARLSEVESVAVATAAKKDNSQQQLQQLVERWQQQLDRGLGEAKSQSSEQARSIQAVEQRLDDGLEELRSNLSEQRAELARYSANDMESWLLAEAGYLLRLANQRLVMAGDSAAAQALLGSADTILRDMDDAGLHQVRAAVAADLAAVRAVPAVDVEGIYLRLAALVDQAGRLVIFQLPEQEAQPRDAAAQDWRDRLRQGYEDALLKLSDYVIIRRRDVPMQALMDPQWERLVRQNLRMLLEQAQVALLSGNQSLYRESLQRAQHWVAEFFESDEAAARAMAREITQLEDATVAVAMPDISRSLQALDDAIQQRLQQGGVE